MKPQKPKKNRTKTQTASPKLAGSTEIQPGTDRPAAAQGNQPAATRPLGAVAAMRNAFFGALGGAAAIALLRLATPSLVIHAFGGIAEDDKVVLHRTGDSSHVLTYIAADEEAFRLANKDQQPKAKDGRMTLDTNSHRDEQVWELRRDTVRR